MKKIALLVVGMAMSIEVAAADRWLVVTTDASGGAVSIDSKTYQRGAFPEFWVQYAKDKCDEGDTLLACSAKVKYKVNCKAMELANLRVMRYGKDGATTYDSGLKKTVFTEPIPESIGEGIVEFVCRK